MAAYELKTFADLISAVREELKIQAGDTASIARIKRNINIVYLNEVLPFARWWWARGSVQLTVPAYINAGTAAISQGSNVVTLTSAPANSQKGKLFSIDGYNEVYVVNSHTAGATTLYLERPYSGTTVTTGNYKLWTDRIPLPSDCRETEEVWHYYSKSPMEGLGRQEFRRRVAMQPRAEGRVQYYSTGDFVDVTAASTISSLPALSTRASSGVLKTLVFASTVASLISEGDRLEITGSGHYSYNGEVVVSSVSTTTITYIGSAEYQESATADSALTVRSLSSERELDRYRELFVYPSLLNSNTTLSVDYIKDAQPLEDDSDEPIIPIEDRVVLLYGALAYSWARERNPEEAARNDALYQRKLARMAGKVQDSIDKPLLKPSRDYLSGKRVGHRQRNIGMSSTSFGGGSSGQNVTGTASMAAVFGSDGNLTASSTVSSTELGYLDGADSNIQDQLDAITTLASGAIYVGNGSNVATEVTPSGDVTITTAGVTAIEPGVIVNADVNANAAIAVSKLAALTASRAIVSDASGFVSASAITSTEITYLDDNEPLTTVALADNQAAAANVATWTAASFDVIQLQYSLKRGSANIETGIISLSTDGTNAAIAIGNMANLGTLGVTFSADVSGGALRLRYTSTSTGTAPSFKYKLNKWLA
jgi:hypothetical protein